MVRRPFLNLKERNMTNENKKRRAYVARHVGEKILIGEGIVVRVSKIEGKRVIVYVETPGDIEIQRPSKDEDRKDRNFNPSRPETEGEKE